MRPINDLTARYVRSIFDYIPATGILRWKKTVGSNRPSRGGNARGGRIAGVIGYLGYRFLRIDGRDYYAHRIIYLWMMGQWPAVLMDHSNGDRSDNRWENIRPANDKQNGQNQKLSKRNTSGFKGVSWRRNRKHWIAQIKANGKHRYLGSFADKKSAYRAYCAAAKSLHGDFANFG